MGILIEFAVYILAWLAYPAFWLFLEFVIPVVVAPALIGLVVGAFFGIYALGLGLVNTLGSIALFFQKSAQMIIDKSKHYFQAGLNFIKYHFPNAIAQVFALTLFALPLLLGTSLLTAWALTKNTAIMLVNISKSILLTLAVAIASPVVGLFSAVFFPSDPLRGAIDSLKDFVNLLSSPTNEAERPRPAVAHPMQSMMQFTAVHLPLNQSVYERRNHSLARKITELSLANQDRMPLPQLSEQSIQRISELKEDHPSRKKLAEYQGILESNSCSISLSNLKELNVTEAVTVEYKDQQDHWHHKVFELESLLSAIRQSRGFASLPEGRIPLTSLCHHAWKQKRINDKELLELDNGKMKIYKGIKPELRESLSRLSQELEVASQSFSLNRSAFFANNGAQPQSLNEPRNISNRFAFI